MLSNAHFLSLALLLELSSTALPNLQPAPSTKSERNNLKYEQADTFPFHLLFQEQKQKETETKQEKQKEETHHHRGELLHALPVWSVWVNGTFRFFFTFQREKSRLEGVGCTRAEGGEKDRWLNECASNRRALALLSFQPCHRKTKRPRFSFSALTPARSCSLSLPLLSRSFSEHGRRDSPFRTQPANQRRTLFLSPAVHTHTNIQRERERWTTGERKHATGC